jgi:hypothetical protein
MGAEGMCLSDSLKLYAMLFSPSHTNTKLWLPAATISPHHIPERAAVPTSWALIEPEMDRL